MGRSLLRGEALLPEAEGVPCKVDGLVRESFVRGSDLDVLGSVLSLDGGIFPLSDIQDLPNLPHFYTGR